MKISEYRQRLRDAFYERLERKTGWGKEEVKREFEEAGEQVILELLEKEENMNDAKSIFNVVAVETEPRYCSRCKKSMTNDKDGSTTIGMILEVKFESGQDDTFIKEQLGKYEINKAYQFCWECWLDSLMGVK